MSDFFKNIVGVLSTFTIVDLIDIVAVAVIVYYAIMLAKETRAVQLIKSIGIVFVVYIIANYFEMITLKYLLQQILNVGLIVIVVIFQPEIRRAMEKIGRGRISDFSLSRMNSQGEIEQTTELVNIICDACREIISKEEGALIVIERKIKLGDIVNTGTVVDARPSEELLANLFFKNSPLHDGAVVISGFRIIAAGCYLPLSENERLSKELGTRHRAAVGISEMSDAITIVVSEERGETSITVDSKIYRYKQVNEMGVALKKMLLPDIDKPKKRWKFGGKSDEK